MTTFRRFVSSLFFSLLFSFQVLSFHPSTYNAACIIYNFFMSFIVFMFGIYISPFLQHVNSLVFIFINILFSFWCSLRAKKKKRKSYGRCNQDIWIGGRMGVRMMMRHDDGKEHGMHRRSERKRNRKFLNDFLWFYKCEICRFHFQIWIWFGFWDKYTQTQKFVDRCRLVE